MRNYIVKIGRFWSIALITVISVILSVLITSVILWAAQSEIVKIPILIAIIAPAIIAPAISWYMISLLIKVHNLEEEQRKLATFDFLTGVMTRRSFLESSETLLKQCKRSSQELVIATLDIDDFKSINDTYGHGGGDQVLVSFSRVLQNALRVSDVIGRIGGEEFAVTLFGTCMDDSVFVLEKVRTAAENDKVNYLGADIHYTVSIGVSGFDEKATTEIDKIMKYADDALYYAKSLGKNRIEKGNAGNSTNENIITRSG